MASGTSDSNTTSNDVQGRDMASGEREEVGCGRNDVEVDDRWVGGVT